MGEEMWRGRDCWERAGPPGRTGDSVAATWVVLVGFAAGCLRGANCECRRWAWPLSWEYDVAICDAPRACQRPPPGSYVLAGGYARPPQPTPRPDRRGLVTTVGLVLAIVLATAALVVGIIAINRPAASSSASQT